MRTYTFQIVGFIDPPSPLGVVLDGPYLDQHSDSKCLKPYFPYTNTINERPDNWPQLNQQYVTDPPINFAPNGGELGYHYYDANGYICFIVTDLNLVYRKNLKQKLCHIYVGMDSIVSFVTNYFLISEIL